jgi:8-oxo-dGTP diphosphatase
MRPTNVVAAIIKKENTYLITQRNRDKYLGLKWEFPVCWFN